MAFRTNKMPVLQTKSASGAVASFNTALAMPLASCNIAVNAWQEGSGDPSPDNVRPIHGFSEVNATRCGVNLWDEEWESGYITASGNNSVDANSIRSMNYSPCLPSTSYCFITPITAYVHFYDRNKTWIERRFATAGVATVITSSNNAYYFRLSFYGYGTTYNNNVSFNYPSTDKNYHAYTGNIYTIQFGQEVYRAEIDVVNGVAHCTHRKEIFDGTQYIDLVNWRPQANSVGFSIYTSTSSILPENPRIIADIMSDKLKTVSYDTIFSNDIDSIALYNRLGYAALFFRVTDTSLTTKELVKTWLSNNNIAVVYPIAEPFDIQLSDIPTLSTIIGDNNIFCDTGDVDLTYKDLDIAKRGNFREVFKLPS